MNSVLFRSQDNANLSNWASILSNLVYFCEVRSIIAAGDKIHGAYCRFDHWIVKSRVHLHKNFPRNCHFLRYFQNIHTTSVPSSRLEKKQKINSRKRHAFCNSVLTYDRNRWEFEHVIRSSTGNEIWSIYFNKYFEIWILLLLLYITYIFCVRCGFRRSLPFYAFFAITVIPFIWRGQGCTLQWFYCITGITVMAKHA